MNIELFESILEEKERIEYQELIRETKKDRDNKDTRGRLARLVKQVFSRTGESSNPGPIIGAFTKLYSQPKLAENTLNFPAAKMKELVEYPIVLAHPLTEIAKCKDAASQHKAILDLGETLLIYLTGILFGEYKRYWPVNEKIEAELYKNAKRKPSFGVFLGFLRSLVKADGESILDHLFHKKLQLEAVSEFVFVYDLLTKVINQGQDDSFQVEIDKLKKERSSSARVLLNFYDSFISMRNNYAHPDDKAKNPERKWPLGEDYYNIANPYALAGLEELIANSVVITEYRPILVEELDQIKLNGRVLFEVGNISDEQSISIEADNVELLTSGSRFIVNNENLPFCRLYYNEIPQLNPIVAKNIISQEKAKMLEPVLIGMINEYLRDDGEIDEDEYLSLRLTAQSGGVHDKELNQIISAARRKSGMSPEFDIIESHQTKDTGPIFNPWWINYFSLRNGISDLFDEKKISDVRKGKVEEQGSSEYFHRLVWSEISDYTLLNKEKYLDDETQNWTLDVNQWQQGRLTGYYWARLYPEKSPIGAIYHIALVVNERDTTAALGIHDDHLACLQSKEQNIDLVKNVSNICVKFLEENRHEFDNVAIKVQGWFSSFMPQDNRIFSLFPHEFIPSRGGWSRLYNLHEYYEKIHCLAQEGKFIICGMGTSSSLNSDEIQRSHMIGLKLISGIISRITDFALEKGITLDQRDISGNNYSQIKESLKLQVISKIRELTIDSIIDSTRYQQIIDTVFETKLRYQDFLAIKEILEQQGITFLDGSYINRLSLEQTESMDSIFDRFIDDCGSNIKNLFDSPKRREDLLLKSHLYAIRLREDKITAMIGFRWTNTNQVYSILQFEGHRNNFGQVDAFSEWVAHNPNWNSIEPDGSYRLNLNSGRKAFSIERQVDLPAWPWSEEQADQIITILSSMLPEWEKAKLELVIEE